MSIDNCVVVETAIKIGWEGVYFNISNELYEWMNVNNQYMFKIHGYNDHEDHCDFSFYLRCPTWQINKFSMNSIIVLFEWR